MNRCVVISSNDNPDYLFFLPLVSWAWKKIGWEVITIFQNKSDITNLVINNLDDYAAQFGPMSEYRCETQYQCIRLYVANWIHEDYYILTTDADMLPLSDYWKPDYEKFTSWGRDLTDYHNPICYLGAPVKIWKEVMNLTGSAIHDMLRDFEANPKVNSENKVDWWGVDQDIITERLLNYSYVRQDRGIAPNSHFPLGRIDRGAWELTLQQPLRIDAHLLRPGYSDENWPRIMKLIQECFDPTAIEIEWMENYRQKYISLL